MKRQIAALSLAALAAAAPVSASAERLTGEEQLAKLLEGRIAGEPTSCVPSTPSARLYVIDKTALIYDTGRTIYVNYTAHPDALDDNEILVVRDATPSLCRTTQVSMRDRSGGFFAGPVFLTDFIPYKRPAKEG